MLRASFDIPVAVVIVVPADETLPFLWPYCIEAADDEEDEAEEMEEDGTDEETVEMRRSLPRPFMPLLEFLYRSAKYSQISWSCGLM